MESEPMVICGDPGYVRLRRPAEVVGHRSLSKFLDNLGQPQLSDVSLGHLRSKKQTPPTVPSQLYSSKPGNSGVAVEILTDLEMNIKIQNMLAR
jgi:hypothetical protein